MCRLAFLCVVSTVITWANFAAAGPVSYAVIDTDTGAGQFGTLDLGTGAFTPIGPGDPNGYSGIAAVPGGFFAITGLGDVVRINPSTGAETFVGASGISSVQNGYTFTSVGGKALFAADVSNHIYNIDAATGAATLVGSTGIPPANALNSIFAFSLSGDGRNLYYTYESTDPAVPSQLFSVNTATGLATAIGPIGLEFVGTSGFVGGTLYGIGGDVFNPVATIVTIDPATGATTVQGQTSLFVTGIADLIAVPEPTSAVLAGIGLIAAATWRRRRVVTAH